MANEPQKKPNNNEEKVNWTRIIVTIISLGTIVMLGLWWFGVFEGEGKQKTISHFETRLKEDAKDAGDDNYMKNISADEFSRKLHVVEVVDGKEVSYSINSTTDYMNQFLVQKTTTNQDSIYELTQNAIKNSAGKDGKIATSSMPKSRPSFFSIAFITLMAISVFSSIWFYRRTQRAYGNGVNGFGSNPARKIKSNKKFSDVAGQQEVKEEIEEVVDFLKRPNKYKAAGARIPKGILLGGPPGTGKTLLAKATAGEANVPFYFISASNFVEMFAGMGAKRVREVFKEARKSAPAILFIDELDAVGRKRGSSFSGNDEREQTLNQILVEMDGMAENTGLLVIAATNRPDVLDPALQRPGRFDRTITVNNPDIKERELILMLHAKGKRIDKNVDFKNIAKRTPGYSGAQLENIVNEAALLSVREKTGVITIEQIDEAIDRVVAGPAKKHRTITPEEMQMVAYHEAGHAVIGLKVADAELVQKITIIPRGSAGGYTLMTPKKETYNYKKSELEAKIVSFMGGRAAEQIIYGEGEVSTGAHNDIERATSIARAMVTQYGMSILGPIAYERSAGAQFLGQERVQKDYSDVIAARIDEAIRELVTNAEKIALEIINKNKKLLKLIADELLEKETIVIEEIDYINNNLKRLPKKEKIVVKEKTQSLEEIISEVKANKDNKEDK